MLGLGLPAEGGETLCCICEQRSVSRSKTNFSFDEKQNVISFPVLKETIAAGQSELFHRYVTLEVILHLVFRLKTFSVLESFFVEEENIETLDHEPHSIVKNYALVMARNELKFLKEEAELYLLLPCNL